MAERESEADATAPAAALTLGGALALASVSSRKSRLECWSSVLRALDEVEAGEAEAALVADEVAGVLEIYSDSASQRALEDAVGAVARRSDVGAAFVRALASRLVAVAGKGGRQLTALGQMQALRAQIESVDTDLARPVETLSPPHALQISRSRQGPAQG